MVSGAATLLERNVGVLSLPSTRLITAQDIAHVVASVGVDHVMDAMISRLEKSFLSFDANKYSVPARFGVNYSAPCLGLIEWMPVLKHGESASVKTVTYHPENPRANGLPSIMSFGSLFDARTGRLQALIESTFLTAVRTGAASAVASRLMAKTDASTIGILGTGAQAVTQLHALSRCFPVKTVLYSDTDADATASFPSRVGGVLPEEIILAAAAPEDIIAQVDILCTCSSVAPGEGPLFEDAQTRDWLHVNAVGADFPGKTELPTDLLLRSLVVPDHREQAAVEGECQALETSQIGPDLVTMLQTDGGNLNARNRVTVFDSTGYALEDDVAMAYILELADQHSAGSEIDLSYLTGDPLNPYDFNMPAGHR